MGICGPGNKRCRPTNHRGQEVGATKCRICGNSHERGHPESVGIIRMIQKRIPYLGRVGFGVFLGIYMSHRSCLYFMPQHNIYVYFFKYINIIYIYRESPTLPESKHGGFLFTPAWVLSPSIQIDKLNIKFMKTTFSIHAHYNPACCNRHLPSTASGGIWRTWAHCVTIWGGSVIWENTSHALKLDWIS